MLLNVVQSELVRWEEWEGKFVPLKRAEATAAVVVVVVLMIGGGKLTHKWDGCRCDVGRTGGCWQRYLYLVLIAIASKDTRGEVR